MQEKAVDFAVSDPGSDLRSATYCWSGHGRFTQLWVALLFILEVVLRTK